MAFLKYTPTTFALIKDIDENSISKIRVCLKSEGYSAVIFETGESLESMHVTLDIYKDNDRDKVESKFASKGIVGDLNFKNIPYVTASVYIPEIEFNSIAAFQGGMLTEVFLNLSLIDKGIRLDTLMNKDGHSAGIDSFSLTFKTDLNIDLTETKVDDETSASLKSSIQRDEIIYELQNVVVNINALRLVVLYIVLPIILVLLIIIIIMLR